MSKLFLSMLIGAAIMLFMNDDSKDGFKASVHTAAMAVAEAVGK